MNEPSKSFFIYAKRHCPRRSIEASKIYKYLVKNGLHPVNDLKKADFIIIYTCGGFETYEEVSILTVEKALKNRKKSAKIIVSGCLPKINPKVLEKYDEAYIIPATEIEQLDSIINADFAYAESPDVSLVYGIHDFYRGRFIQRLKRYLGFNTKFLRVVIDFLRQKLSKSPDDILKDTYRIEIARGCLGTCSYCAIKLAMPKFYSFSEEKILENFKFGLKSGYRNFSLLAGDIGCYGVDIGTNLPTLLRKLLAIDGDYTLVLVDLNPRWLVKYFPDFLSVIKANSDKVTKLMMPIQSGSNRLLKRMHRHYDIDEVKNCILELQKNIPTLMIETHIMVGFPGETNEDFQKSVELVQGIKFSKVEVYSYEARPSTEASILPDQVPKETMDKRRKILTKIVAKKGKLLP